MAEKIDITFGCNNKQVTQALGQNAKAAKEVAKALKSAAEAAKVANKAMADMNKAQSGFQNTTGSNSKGKDDQKGILGWFKRLSVQIRAMHLHGIDPATNKFARFFSVLGGAGITSVTLFTTAIMGVYFALKKVNQYLETYFGALEARANTLIKISKSRVKEIQEEGKQVDKVIEELKKLNEKEKLNNIEKNISITLVQKIKAVWGQVGIQIDKNTGKIKNFNEVQARIQRVQAAETADELQKQIQYQNTKLDLALGKYTGKNNLFSRLAGKDPIGAFSSFDIFRGRKIEDITAFDLFPSWINRYDDPEAVRKMDIGKLFFGNTQTQIDFLREVASHLIDVDDFNGLNAIIDGLFQKLDLQKSLDKIVDPSGKNQRVKEAQDTFDKSLERRDKVEGQLDSINKDRQKFNQSIEYDQKSTEEKLSIQKQKLSAATAKIDQYKKEKEDFDKKWEDLIVYNEEGELTTQGIHSVVKRNQKLQDLYSKYLRIEEKYRPYIKQIDELQAEYNKNQKIVDKFNTASSWSIGGSLNKPQEVKDAEKWIEDNKQKIQDKWDFVNLNRTVDRNTLLGSLMLGETDLKDARILDQEFTKLDEYNKDLGTMEKNKDLLKEAVQEVKEATTQQIKLQKQLADERVAALKAIEDQFEALEQMVAEEVKVTNQRKGYLTGMGNNLIAQYMKDTGQGRSLRRQQLYNELKEQLGVTELTDRQKRIADRAEYIEYLQNQKQIEDQANPFKYNVKTNSLAARGGWNSSVYVGGKDGIAQQQLRNSNNQVKVLNQINKLMPDLRDELKALNKNIQI